MALTPHNKHLLKAFLAPLATTLMVCLIFGSIFYLVQVPFRFFLYATALSFVFSVGIGFYRVLAAWRYLGALADLQRSPTSAKDLVHLEPLLRQTLSALAHMQEQNNTRQALAHRDLLDTLGLWVHQMKTPLSAARLALQHHEPPPERVLPPILTQMNGYVDMAIACIELAEEDPFLDISTVDVDAVLTQSLQKTATLFVYGNVTLDYTPTDLHILSDSRWLALLLEQILSNAAKYANGGNVVIEAEDETLHIRDNGPGIPADELPRVFERGFAGTRGRIDSRASGMGLYLAKEIAHRLGHRIAISSRLGEGTSVSLHLSRPDLLDEVTLSKSDANLT